YHYFTILRDPVQRYLSEWKHVRRGSTWSAVKLMCNGRRATRSEVPLCYSGPNWINVTFDDFLACQHNLAHNRQTRMLADLTLVGCYDKSLMSEEKRNRLMLESAKRNLMSMEFFGLTEFQAELGFLFEFTFGIKFTKNFTQYEHTHAKESSISQDERRRIMQLNHLDVQLYDFAKHLFLARLNYALSQQKLNEVSSRENVFMDNDGNSKHPIVDFVDSSQTRSKMEPTLQTDVISIPHEPPVDQANHLSSEERYESARTLPAASNKNNDSYDDNDEYESSAESVHAVKSRKSIKHQIDRYR
ncbi:hypothetical protein HELRODRAFT_73819, partial [Helobdella robusta]|uniref:Heparan-sulfate 6-O-sulfotransferase n=1 Tax=Helobdella robusta TaxID=6412 RepID=T1G1I7_HELRO